MATWSNEQYAKWLIKNRVPEKTMCLVEVRWDDKSGWVPFSVSQISKFGLEGTDLFVEPNKKVYQAMHFSKTKEKGIYVVGIGEATRHKKGK